MSPAYPSNKDLPPGAPSDKDIVDSIVDFAIIASNLEGRITRWNEGAVRIFGWTADEILGRAVSTFFTPEDNAIGRPETEMEQALLLGRSSDERWHIRKNGERFWASGELMRLHDEDGQLEGYVKVLSDRTNHRLAVADIVEHVRSLEEQSVLNTTARNLVWSNSPDLLLIVGIDGVIIDLNPAWTTLLGWDSSDLVGKQFETLVHPDDLTTSHQALVVASSGKLPNFENRYRHKDGSYRWILWTSSPEAGTIYAIGKDITVEKAHVEALLRSEDALRQSQKMEAVGQLTGGLAHDFNNMLAGIIGNLELLQLRVGQGKTEGLTRYLQGAMAVANRAAALTHRLLAFSRRQTLDSKPTNVNDLVRGMTELLQRTLGPGIFLETLIHDDPLTVLCDANQLESALLNLAINSRDAMPLGGRLTVQTTCTKVDRIYDGDVFQDMALGHYVELTVKDTGVGMAPDVLRRALDPFFTTKPTGQGTGLGLSMVYGFVKQSKGYLHIQSKPDVGTSVRVFLPPIAAVAEAAKQAEAVSSLARTASGVKILLVEDEGSVRKVACEILTDLGYAVTEAEDAREALKKLDEIGSIGLLVTDVGLPNGMNGRQLADAVRESQPGLNVLFITGFADVAAVGEGLLSSGMQVLTKPFSMAMFADKVQSIVGKSSPQP